MNRTLGVVRMQFVNRNTYIWVPLMVLFGALVLSVAIFAMIPYDGAKVGGGSQAPLWYFLVIGVQALTLTFPFSQAMSVSRREYFFGTMLTAALTAAFLAVVFVLGGLLEQATVGWGVNGYFFYLDGLWESGPFGALLSYFVIAMLFFTVGFWGAGIYKRFGNLWLTVILVGISAVLVAALFVIIRTDAWASIGAWIAAQGTLGMTLWGALLAALIAASAYLTLRRTVP